MLSDRLKLALAEGKMSQVALAAACGVKPPSVNGWLSGKAKFLRGANLLKAAKALKVNQQWLADGTGPMRIDASNPPPDRTSVAPAAINSVVTLAQTLESLRTYLADVDPENRAAIAGLLSAVAQNPNNTNAMLALHTMMDATFAQPSKRRA